MERFVQDLKYALRVLGAERAFTLAAVAALALGIGATTAVFSVVDAVLLKPLAYPDPDRIVMFMNTSPQGSGPGASPAKFMFWSSQTAVIQEPTAFRNVTVNFTGGDTPEQLTSGNVSANFFRLWGARTTLGRTFSADEDRPEGPKVAVLSYGWWTRRFGADPSVIGKTILLSGQQYTVIGVVEKGFDASEFMDNPDVWTAFQLDPLTVDQAHYFRAAARLRPGVTLAQAQAKLKQSAAGFVRNIRTPSRRATGSPSSSCKHSWCAMRRRCSTYSSPPLWECSLSRARTWRTSCSSARRGVAERWQFAPRSARIAAGSCANSSPRASCSR